MRISNFDILENSFSNNNNIEKLQSLVPSEKKKLIDASKEQKEKEADAVAKEFETMFVDMMLKSMRETVKPEEESNAEGIYKNMLDGEYSKAMTDAQSFGIREMVYKWITENNA